ncbi:MAG: recombinase family protein [Candidatus Yanofskybacteria bacterium]|nr:recombinase family protein [Candidatus Yanofskybacteria bacterium]
MSIEAQLAELKEYAKRENILISETFIESKSAKKPGREVFNEMMAKVESSREPVGLLAWHPDRLARNSIDGGQIIYSIDQSKIVSLRFPTFWFEPTPQGLFMLQVAFGQSKYYSDNLSENVKRGIRQKLRRGEWLTKAPFGYLNNPKTRTIEPHPTLSKILVKAFEAYATGKYTLESLGRFLAEYGIESKNRTPLSKANIKRILTNQAYLGLIAHKGEYFEGKFQPILNRATFEAVQEVLQQRAKPRKTKQGHNFPFTGLMTCGECNSQITAQWTKGKSGGIYRYYRCTKKRGACSQKYIQEKDLVIQIKTRLQSVALPDTHTDWMLKKVDEWDKDKTNKTASSVQNIKFKIVETQEKLDKLVSAYMDGDIPKESYLTKKEDLLKIKVSLVEQKTKPNQKNPLEPLRQWVLDTKKASFLASSENYHEMKQIIQKIGTNPKLSDRSLSFSFIPPSGFLASRLAGCAPTIPFAPLARPDFSVSESESIFLCLIVPNDACCRYTTARFRSQKRVTQHNISF